jgi:hypothetical protein
MKRISIVITLLIAFQSTFACDICGCSSGSYFIGPYPHFQKKFAGIRYSFRNYFSRMADDPTEFSKDLYQTAELVGGFSIGKRWQLMAFIPYNINRQEMEHHPHEKQGIGDVSLLGNYQVLNKKSNQLLIGGGLKLPTGKFNPGFASHPVPSANVQPGTGSLDVILNATDVLQWTKWSLHSNVNYKINGTAKEFRFGDRLNASAIVSRMLGNRIGLNPYAGLQYEHLAANKYQKSTIEDTGGQALLGTAGMDVQMAKINVGLNVQLPVAQNFSNHQTDSKLRGMVQVSVVF